MGSDRGFTSLEVLIALGVTLLVIPPFLNWSMNAFELCHKQETLLEEEADYLIFRNRIKKVLQHYNSSLWEPALQFESLGKGFRLHQGGEESVILVELKDDQGCFVTDNGQRIVYHFPVKQGFAPLIDQRGSFYGISIDGEDFIYLESLELFPYTLVNRRSQKMQEDSPSQL